MLLEFYWKLKSVWVLHTTTSLRVLGCIVKALMKKFSEIMLTHDVLIVSEQQHLQYKHQVGVSENI